MKSLLKALLIIGGILLLGFLSIIGLVFFFLGVLPVIYPPSAVVIIPIAALLFYWALDIDGCNKKDDDF